MLRKLFILLTAVFPLGAVAQVLTLAECKALARDNYPLIRQHALIEKARDYSLANASKAWLPSVSVSGTAAAFTDLLDPSPAMQSMGIDTKNYVVGGNLVLKQNVYDGGSVTAQKAVAKADAEVSRMETEVKLYEVNERVEQLYFGVLLLDGRLEQNRLLQNDLSLSHTTAESMVRHGVANQSDVDRVRVEQLRARQQADVLAASRSAYLKMLALYVGRTSLDSATLVKPDMSSVPTTADFAVRRPEQRLFDAQHALWQERKKQLDARLRPSVSFVGLGSWHTSVSPLLHNAFAAGGITLAWNVGALYTRKNDLARIENARQLVENSRETFLFNTRLQDEQTAGAVAAYRIQLSTDREIVSLEESIVQTIRAKVEGGTETMTELLRHINAADRARVQQSVHEISLLQEIYRRHHLQGTAQ